MQASLIFLALSMLPGCKHLALGIPIEIRAAIEGNIKGVNIKCENSLELNHGQWGAMCQAEKGIKVQYQVKSLPGKQSKVKFLIAKEKAGRQKIIAAPTLILKKNAPSYGATTTHNSDIQIKAERIN